MPFSARSLLEISSGRVADSDSELARKIQRDDGQLDQLHKSILVWAREEIPRDPESTNAAIELLAKDVHDSSDRPRSHRFERLGGKRQVIHTTGRTP